MFLSNKKIAIFIIGILAGLNVYAGQVVVKASIDSAKIKIGEQARITLSVTKGKSDNVIFPAYTDTLGDGIEVVGITNRDTTELDDEMESVSQQIVVTSFDSTLALIKPFVFTCNGDSFLTEELSLKVDPVHVDTLKNDLKDIKPIYDAPVDWRGILLTILLVAVVIAAVVGLWFLYRKYRKKKAETTEEKEVVPENPYLLAIRKLDEIKSEKVWQKGLLKRYYTDVTDVLREYVKFRFDIDAPEMTSDQILSSLALNETFGGCVEKDAIIGNLSEVLRIADLVKFAKWQPSFSDNDRIIAVAYDFIEKTKPVEEASGKSDSVKQENQEQ
jgi:hypothetical protein